MLWHSNVLFVYRKLSNYSKISDYVLAEKWSQNNCLLNISWHHKTLSRSKNWFLGGPLGGSRGGWHPQTMSKYLSVKYLLISKQTGTQVELFKKLIFGGPFGGVPGEGGTPKLCQNICLLNIDWYPKKLAPYINLIKKLMFGGPFGGVPGGVLPPNHV